MKLNFLFAVLLLGTTTFAQVGRNVDAYNPMLDARKTGVTEIGLYGYDPVSYFSEGGGVPKLGSTSLEMDHEGVTYRFSSESNREVFLNNPEKYEPTYGGWCAYAMSFGSTIDIDPLIYTIHGNRIHFFVNERPKELFDEDIIGFEGRADQKWLERSGEEPRL